MPIKFEITTKDGGTLHTAEKYCEEDINIVPKLQDKTVTENGTVTADAGYAGLGEVTVNVKTGGEELNIAYGDAAPSDTSQLWVKANEPTNVLVLPTVLGGIGSEQTLVNTCHNADGIACATVGNKIYLFGGYTSSPSNAIYEFNSEDETCVVVASLPIGMTGVTAVSVGKQIYIFGGDIGNDTPSEKCYVFNTDNYNITKLGSTLPIPSYYMAGAEVGNKIFLFGGQTGALTHSNAIQVYDIETDTIWTHATTLFDERMDISAVTIGSVIYLFGGYGKDPSYDSIYHYSQLGGYIFDTIGGTIEYFGINVGATGGTAAECRHRAILCGGKIFCLYAYDSLVYEFDLTTHDFTSTGISWTTGKCGISAIGRSIYTFRNKAIRKIQIEAPLEYDSMLIQARLSENGTRIVKFNSVYCGLDIESVYLGNTNGIAEKVEAYVYSKEAIKTPKQNLFTSSTTELTSGTSLSASVECSVGDLVICAIATRDTLTVSSGWTLVSTSKINSTDTTGNGQRLSWAYKYATSTTETITVTQASAQRLYINMVALSGATGITDNGYSYRDNDTGGSMTIIRPNGLVLWGATAPLWDASSPYDVWAVSNDSSIIQVGSSTQSRLAIIADQSEDEKVTITAGASATTMIVGSLTIEGVDKFYTPAVYGDWIII